MRLSGWLLIAGALIEIVACGQSNNGNVFITSNPEKPVVILADLTLYAHTDHEKKITAPWFKYLARVKNDSNTILTVCSFFHTITTIKDGKEVSREVKMQMEDSYWIAEIPPKTTTTIPYTVYVSGLPQGDPGLYSYSVNIELEGWFGDHDNPTERAQATMSLTTQ